MTRYTETLSLFKISQKMIAVKVVFDLNLSPVVSKCIKSY